MKADPLDLVPVRHQVTGEERAARNRHYGAVLWFTGLPGSGKSTLAMGERRDPKGHYRRARAGEIKDFTGVDAPYETPETPAIVVDTEAQDVDACVDQLVAFVVQRCWI